MISLIMLCLYSCKDYEPEVEGVWDVVNVGNIDNPDPREWHFLNNELKIYKVENPDSPILHDTGRYIVRNSVDGLTMRIGEMSNQGLNNEWIIMKLRKGKMILSVEIPGGIIYKEFTKSRSN